MGAAIMWWVTKLIELTSDYVTKSIPKSFLGDRVEETLFLNPVTDDELLTIVHKCKSKASKGYDGIDMHLVKSHSS